MLLICVQTLSGIEPLCDGGLQQNEWQLSDAVTLESRYSQPSFTKSSQAAATSLGLWVGCDVLNGIAC